MDKKHIQKSIKGDKMNEWTIKSILTCIFLLGMLCMVPAYATDEVPAPATKEQLQTEWARVQRDYAQLKTEQRANALEKENLAYKEEKLVARAKEIQEALKKLEPKKEEKEKK
jgi:hypothetical protein